MATHNTSPEDINTINKEERSQLRQQKKEILSKKISPAKKQAQWNALLFPLYERSVIPY